MVSRSGFSREMGEGGGSVESAEKGAEIISLSRRSPDGHRLVVQKLSRVRQPDTLKRELQLLRSSTSSAPAGRGRALKRSSADTMTDNLGFPSLRHAAKREAKAGLQRGGFPTLESSLARLCLPARKERSPRNTESNEPENGHEGPSSHFASSCRLPAIANLLPCKGP